jgi:hypothetical protein
VRVLLDENLPHKLRLVFERHEVFTAAYMGWEGVKNGELISRAETEGFQVFLTADRNLEYQQNLEKRRIAMVFLTAQDWEVIKPHLDKIVAAVDEAHEGSYRLVDCGRFSRA